MRKLILSLLVLIALGWVSWAQIGSKGNSDASGSMQTYLS